MKKKLNKILLVDDSESDNFYHARIIKKCNVAENIVIKLSAEEALEYLKTLDGEKYPAPELLFLDINMPGMNGWEFLEAYANLDNDQLCGIVVTMLTTSQNDDDRSRATSDRRINHFHNKPLTAEYLMQLMQEHFPENF
ncbi:MAG: response regulator [Cytophagaceae bacterium]|nr:response regulator [Cytophagaceae bacterium]|tara:strand:- start:22511 stop:22927 length:417 start_codon:yes stop_codon:yes gene_type:complete